MDLVGGNTWEAPGGWFFYFYFLLFALCSWWKSLIWHHPNCSWGRKPMFSAATATGIHTNWSLEGRWTSSLTAGTEPERLTGTAEQTSVYLDWLQYVINIWIHLLFNRFTVFSMTPPFCSPMLRETWTTGTFMKAKKKNLDDFWNCLKTKKAKCQVTHEIALQLLF